MREYKPVVVDDIREWFMSNYKRPYRLEGPPPLMPFSEGLGRMFKGLQTLLDPYFIPNSEGQLRSHENNDLFLCIWVKRTQPNGEWCAEMLRRALWACCIDDSGAGFDLKTVPDFKLPWSWFYPQPWRGDAGSTVAVTSQTDKLWDSIFNSNLLRYIWVCEITRRLDVAGYDMGDKDGTTDTGENQTGG